MNVRRVQQEDAQGCAIACLAMVLGCTYAEARARIAVDASRGITSTVYDDVLVTGGFALQRLYRRVPALGIDRDVWPPAPFAPLHIAQTDTAEGSHLVVMLADGSVLYPWKPDRKSLHHSDYRCINSVTGVWRVAAERAA